MARKVSEQSLLRLAAAYARSFPGEVAERLGESSVAESAQFLDTLDVNTAVDLLETSPDAFAANLLKQLSDEGFERLVVRLHRRRLEALKTLNPGLAERLKPKPA